MTEHFKSQEPSRTSGEEPGLLELLKKIQQQLVFLERKIDALGGGAPQRPFHKGMPFSRKPRSFDRPHRHEDARREQDPGQEHLREPQFKKRYPGDERHGFSHFKKPFFRHRKGHG